MIRNFTDHAANQRTFLAWLRTGVSIIAFGFVIEKFNIFLATLAMVGAPAQPAEWITRRQIAHGAFLPYEGLTLMLLGLAVIGGSAVRFVRIAKVIDAGEQRPALGVVPELTLTAALTILTLLYCVHVYL
jgi:putative membrane protein